MSATTVPLGPWRIGLCPWCGMAMVSERDAPRRFCTDDCREGFAEAERDRLADEQTDDLPLDQAKRAAGDPELGLEEAT